MKLIEKCIYSLISFTAVYVFLSLALRLFEVTSDYTSHMLGGIIATLIGVAVFIFLLIKK